MNKVVRGGSWRKGWRRNPNAVIPEPPLGDIDVWNPADMTANIALSNGNRTATCTANNAQLVRGLTGKTGQRIYFELEFVQVPNTGGGSVGGGIAKATHATNISAPGDCVGLWPADGSIYSNGVNIGNLGAGYVFWTSGNRLCGCLDQVVGHLWLGAVTPGGSISWFGLGDPATDTSPTVTGLAGTWFLAASPWQLNINGNGAGQVLIPTTLYGTAPAGYVSGWRQDV